MAQSYGNEIVLNVGLNDIKARKAIQNVNREVRQMATNLNNEVKHLTDMGKFDEALEHQKEGYAKLVEAQKKAIKQEQEVFNNSGSEVPLQEKRALEQRIEKAKQYERALENSARSASVLYDAQEGKLKELINLQDTQRKLTNAHIQNLKSQGQEYDALIEKGKQYETTIANAGEKLQSINTGIKKLEDDGLTDTKAYQRRLIDRERAEKELNQARTGLTQFNQTQPEERLKIDKNRDNIDSSEKLLRQQQKADQARVDALKATGNASYYEAEKAEARIRQMQRLKSQIAKEENLLTDDVANTATGSEMRTSIETMRKEYAELRDEQRRYGEGLDDLNLKNQKTISTLNAQASIYESTGQHFKAQITEAQALRKEVTLLNDQRERETNELKALGETYGTQSTQYINQQRKVSDLTNQEARLNARIVTLNRNTGGAYNSMSKFADYVSQHQKVFDGLGSSISYAGHSMLQFGSGVGYAIAQGTELNYKLEQTNQTTKALLDNANKEDPNEIAKNMKAMQDDDVKLSEQWGVSQQDIAKAQQDLAHRGYDSGQVREASNPLLQASIASGYDLNDVTNVTTSALEAYGLRAPGKQMQRNTRSVANTIAYSSDMSDSSFKDTGTALSYVGATARTAGIDINQTASAIAELSLSGVKAQKAGTGLRKIINSLVSPTKAGKTELQKLGVTITDSKGKLKPFSDIMGELNEKMKGMTGVQKNDIFHNLFGTTGQAAAAILVSNSDALGKFNKQVDEANKRNYMEKLAKQKMDNPVNQINRLKRAWEELQKQMAQSVAPGLSDGIRKLIDLLNAVNNSSPFVKHVFDSFALGIPILGALLIPVGSLIRNIRTVTSVFNGFSSSFQSKTREQTKETQQLNQQLAETHELLTKINDDNAVANDVNTTGSDSGIFKKDATERDKEEANNVEKDVEKTEETASSEGGGFKNLLSSAKNMEEDSGWSKFAKGATAGVGVIDVMNAGSDLIGMNRNNAGEKIGNATGNLGGAVAGGAIGTALAGPIGTMIGSTIGSVAGDKIGGVVGRAIQQYDKQSNYNNSYHNRPKGNAGKVQDQFTQIAGYETELSALKNDYKKNPSSALKKDIKDVEKNLQKAYKNIENDTKVHNQKVSDLNTKGGKQALKSLGISQKEYTSSVNTNNKQNQSLLKSYLKEAENEEKKSGSHKTKTYKDLQGKIADILASGNDTQTNLYKQLANSSTKITDKQAQTMINNSSNMLSTITGNSGEAQKIYNQDMKTADQSRNVQTTYWNAQLAQNKISISTYNKHMKQVNSDYDKAKQNALNDKLTLIQSAQDQYTAVVGIARKQTKDHGTQLKIDTANVQQAVKDQISAMEQLDPNAYKYKKYHGSIWNRIGQWFGGWSDHNQQVDQNRENLQRKVEKGYGIKNDNLQDTSSYGFWGHATGGKIPNNQMALINEKGMESAYDPANNKIRFFQGGPQIAELFSGEYVLNAQDTYKLTHGGLGQNQTLNGYADGTDTLDNDDSGNDSSIKIKNINALSKFKNHSSNIWQEVHDDTKTKVDTIHDNTVKQLTDMKKTSLTLFQNIHDGTISNTKDLVGNFDSIFGQLPTMTQSSVKGSIDELNRGFNGINSTLNQFGSHKNVLQPIHYAGGTNGQVAKEHDAIVNDARNGNQQEAIIRQDGIFLPKYQDALVHLNTGDAVLNGSQTRQFLNATGLAHYASGTGIPTSKLRDLINYGLKNPKGQLNKDFGSNVKENGSIFGNGITGTAMGALDSSMMPWYSAIFQVLSDATGSGTTASKFLKYAKDHYTGDKYQLGANGPDLYDCSSMIESALQHFGIQLGRTTTAMQASDQLTRLGSDLSKARAGDLVLFGHGDGAEGHVGIVNNPMLGTMFNETPPSAGITNINDVTSIPLDGYYRINGLASTGKNKSSLYNLAHGQLGSDRLKWVAEHLGEFGDFNATIPTGDHAYLLKQAGIPESDWADYNYIISHESSWNPTATNPESGAYGLPQSLPANKMASAGSDWRTNPVTQLKWQKAYIESRYGSADNARKYWQQHHNYENGGLILNDQIAHVGEGNKPEMVLPLTDKFRTVQLAKQAMDFINAGDRNYIKGQAEDGRVEKLQEALEDMAKDMDRLVKLTTILAQNSSNPIRAYVTDKDLFKSINKQQQKANMQSALRRGESLV